MLTSWQLVQKLSQEKEASSGFEAKLACMDGSHAASSLERTSQLTPDSPGRSVGGVKRDFEALCAQPRYGLGARKSPLKHSNMQAD